MHPVLRSTNRVVNNKGVETQRKYKVVFKSNIKAKYWQKYNFLGIVRGKEAMIGTEKSSKKDMNKPRKK